MLLACACTGMTMAQVPANGLKAYYCFDDGSSSDISGNQQGLYQTASEGGYTAQNDGKLGKCLSTQFAGTYHSLNNTANVFKFTTQFSISVWIKAQANINSSYAVIVGNRRNLQVPTYNNYALLYNSLVSEIQFIVSDSSIGVPVAQSELLNWTHVAVTYDNGLAKIYINGELKASSTSFPSAISYPVSETTDYLNTLQVGNVYGIGNHSFNQLIDEMAIYDRKLTERDVLALYYATSNDISTNPVWNLVDLNGTVVRGYELSAKDSVTIGTVYNTENQLTNLTTGTVSQYTYGIDSKLASEFKLASNGRAIIRNGRDVFFKTPSEGFTTSPSFAATSVTVNKTDYYAIGGRSQGLFKLQDDNWIILDSTMQGSRIEVADDGSMAIIDKNGNLKTGNVSNQAITPVTDQPTGVQSIAIFDSTLAFVVSLSGEVYKIENGQWTLLTSSPVINRVAISQDGHLFALSNQLVYRYNQTFGRPTNPTGLNKVEIMQNLTMWPNPSNTTVHFLASKPLSEVRLYNITGMEVLCETMHPDAVDVQSLPNGVYWVKVKNMHQQQTVRKLVIQH